MHNFFLPNTVIHTNLPNCPCGDLSAQRRLASRCRPVSHRGRHLRADRQRDGMELGSFNGMHQRLTFIATCKDGSGRQGTGAARKLIKNRVIEIATENMKIPETLDPQPQSLSVVAISQALHGGRGHCTHVLGVRMRMSGIHSSKHSQRPTD